jgi:NAD(P)-dependent dehydrogenase (short-subunit alcohol dehydrogenase family)
MKNYLIIGGSSGIGEALSLLLEKEKVQVFSTFNKNEKQDTEHIKYFKLNVLEELPDFSFLPQTLHGIVYCPGSIKLRPFHRIKAEDFLKDYNLQVVGAIKIIQAVLPRLKNADSASVLLFSTVAVQTGFPFHTQVAASKGALEGLTRSLAADLAPKIRVNCIAPSLTDTPLASSLLNTESKKENNAMRHPLKRIGKASDMAHAAQFLLSENSSWITGQVLPVDGGISTLKL